MEKNDIVEIVPRRKGIPSGREGSPENCRIITTSVCEFLSQTFFLLEVEFHVGGLKQYFDQKRQRSLLLAANYAPKQR